MKRKIILIFSIAMVAILLSGCELLDYETKSIKGYLIGSNFNVIFYDNQGNNILSVKAKSVGLESNYVMTKSISSEGNRQSNYDLSNAIKITVDGSEVLETGSTVIFAEDGVKKLEDFSNFQTDVTNMETINRNLNKIKNIFNVSKIVIICSELGMPIAAYGGNSIRWSIPGDLPETTKLNIDGKALYVHRANYILLDSEIIK